MPSQRPGWGILGAGKIAAIYVDNLLAEGHRVSAVGARDAGRAAEFAAQLGIPTSHGDYLALVSDPTVDVIYVNTTQNFHVDHALLAIEAGKPVLVEKSFTETAVQARQIAAAARAAGVFCMEAMWTRFLPTMVTLRRWIAEGRIGEVTAVTSDHSQYLDRSPDGRHHNPALGGGALLDVGVYNVSLALDLLGRPEQIHAAGRRTPSGVDAEVSMLLQHGGGRSSTGHTSMVNTGPNTASVFGTEGHVQIDPVFYTWTSMTLFAPGRPAVAIDRYEPRPTSRGMHFQAVEVERCLAQGLTESPLCTLDDSIAVMEVMDELRHQLGVYYPGETAGE